MTTEIKTKIFLEKPTLIVFLILAIAVIVHTILTVNISVLIDFLPKSIWFFALCAFIAFEQCIRFDRDDDGKIVDNFSLENVVGTFVGYIVFLSIVLILFYSFYIFFKDMINLISKSNINSYQITFLGGLISILIAYALFIFRLRKRLEYGLSELVVGFYVALHNITAIKGVGNLDSSQLLVILTAGIYLMVRGLDNIYLGVKKKPS
ncbi:hypothetical protein GALL_154670 [mine drainage metagenome]|uniref:Uncharacterized protein n=1 Tax=mine drainage metagenome TaxID=410659 RepID=A0A1J5SLE0_9ZZZZ